MRQLLPATLKTRAICVLATLFLLSHVVGLVIYEYNRDRTIVLTEATDLADRIFGIIELASAFPEQDREQILAAAETQFLATYPDILPADRERCRENDFARQITRRLGSAFQGQPGYRVEACVRGLEIGGALLGGFRQSGFDVLITVHSPDAQRTLFHAVLPDDSSILGDPVLLYFLAVLLVALASAAYLILRVIAPLGRLAHAAEVIGIDIDSPPLAVEGPSEVRAAATALNGMHARLQRQIHTQRDMLAAISHDLRSSLTRLQLRVDMLPQGEQREGLARVAREMQLMLEAALEFARGIDEHEPHRRLELATLLESLCVDMAEEGFAVTWRDSVDNPVITGKPVALRRAFQNLILNAVQYGERAEVCLRVADGVALVEVGDRGPGIPASQLGRVMRPFHRLEYSRNRDTGGVGLGLAIVQNVVQGHGGEVALGNRAGGGLLATVRLPLEPDGTGAS